LIFLCANAISITETTKKATGWYRKLFLLSQWFKVQSPFLYWNFVEIKFSALKYVKLLSYGNFTRCLPGYCMILGIQLFNNRISSIII